MYIPTNPRETWQPVPRFSYSQGNPDGQSPSGAFSPQLMWLWRSIRQIGAFYSEDHLQRRQVPASGSTNTIVGVVLGIVLGLFVLGVCAFLYVYRDSLRRIRRRRRHRSSSSKSSKSSRSSKASKTATEAPPPPPPPAPAPEAA